MKTKRFRTSFAAFLCVLFLTTGLGARAEDPVFVDPTLPPTAERYDADHPELLQNDQLVATSAILIEADTGMVIFEKNADAIMYPASTTKILTAYLGVVSGNYDLVLTADAETVAFDSDTESTIPLSLNEEISMRNLLYATMLKSGNDGAVLIAKGVSGSVTDFVALMNSTAASMGCTSSHFMNPHGLHNDAHYTTARDLAIIARAAMGNDLFRSIVSTVSFTLPKSNINRSRTLTSSNYLINPAQESYYYPYATGIKTGYTSRAGYCLVSSAEKDGISLISVVLYTSRRGRWSDSEKLFEYGFSQYKSTSVAQLYEQAPRTVDVSGFALDDPEMGRLKLNIERAPESAPDGFTVTHDRETYLISHFSQMVTVEYTRDITAPITTGEVVGMMTYYNTMGEAVIYNLVASRSVAAREGIAPTIDEIIAYTDADPNPFPRFTLEIALMIIGILLALYILYLLLRVLLRPILGLRKRTYDRRLKPENRYYQ